MLGRSGEAPQGGQQLKAGAHLPSLGEGLDACVAYSVLGFRGSYKVYYRLHRTSFSDPRPEKELQWRLQPELIWCFGPEPKTKTLNGPKA